MTAENSLPPRQLGRLDIPRFATVLIAMALTFSAFYFLLPVLQRLTLPTAPGGVSRPWVLRPILAVHFCACAFMTAVSVPLILRSFRRRWQLQDGLLGTRFDPFHQRPGRRVALYAKGLLLFGIYGLALLFYLLSWEMIGPNSVEQHFLWTTRRHTYGQITSLATLPNGMRSNSLAKSGPWYEVHFADGKTLDFGKENEGTTDAELATIASFIAARSGQPWKIREDARQE